MKNIEKVQNVRHSKHGDGHDGDQGRVFVLLIVDHQGAGLRGKVEVHGEKEVREEDGGDKHWVVSFS